MHRFRRIFVKVLIVVAVIALCTTATGYMYFRLSLPQTTGTVHISGLRATVSITRDADAVPHIRAENELDAYVGLGYVHAQDRLWQMEWQRRIGQGRLAEILGAPVVSNDRLMRTLGLYRAAIKDWNVLPPESQAPIIAYITGINAFLDTHHGSALPPEFTILGVTVEHWEGSDVLLWARMMAWNLSANARLELIRHDIIQAVGLERAQELLPTDTQIGSAVFSSNAHYRDLQEQEEQLRRLLGFGGHPAEGYGSNGWVIDGTKSVTKSPLLANDLHLAPQIPSLWYLAHMTGGDLDVIGATLPGLPSVVIGRNQSIAWGVAALGADVTDHFRERLDASGRMVEFQGRMEPLQSITETIQVKNAPPIQQIVRITRHGPIISDALNLMNAAEPPERRPPLREVLALRWVGLDRDDRTVEAFRSINKARNWDEFVAALALYGTPAQNFVYADQDGNIGSYVAGRIPIRSAGDGSLPTDGWSGQYEWTGSIPFEQLPHTYNPPTHFIVTANNNPTPADYRYFLGQEWAPNYRAQRISELLESKPQLNSDDFAAIQQDTVSLQARDLLTILLALVQPTRPAEQQAVALLQAWDGNMQSDSPAAALFGAWQARLPQAIVKDELGERLTNSYQSYGSYALLFLADTLADRSSPWCDNSATPAMEDCAAVAQQTFAEAIDELTKQMGSDIHMWRWGELHAATFPHLPFDTAGPLQLLFSRSVPHGGDSHTINSGAFSVNQPSRQTALAGYLQIVDLAKEHQSLFIQSVGQSGHVLSQHYDDYLADWSAGRYRRMYMQHESAAASEFETLQLVP